MLWFVSDYCEFCCIFGEQSLVGMDNNKYIIKEKRGCLYPS